MIISIHQPNLFPWLGYFDKMRRCDVFVLLDTVPFTKGGYQNRVRVKGPKGPQWLTIPVATAGKLGQPTRSVSVEPGSPWRRNHLGTLGTFYRQAPYFGEMLAPLESLYEGDAMGLVDFCIPGIYWIRERLGIGTRIVRASDLSVGGAGSELLCGLVEALGGHTYLSGPSGRGYLDTAHFASRGIGLEFHDFVPFEYSQLYPPFAPFMSALDFLFNVGPHPWWRV